MRSFLLLSLLIFISSSIAPPLIEAPKPIDFLEVRNKMLNCLLQADGISAELRDYATTLLNSKDLMPIRANRHNFTAEDRTLMRECWNKNAGNGGLIHRPRPRKLSEVKEPNRFNPSGIFTCIEHAQPMAQAIRHIISLINSQDYFGAIQYLWDNIGTFTDTITYCFNELFPEI